MSLNAALWLVLAVCVCHLDRCVCFPNGSVAFSCGHMLPVHPPYSAAASSPPFTVSASSSTYRPGGVITVTVEGVDNSSEFQGFLLQARSTQQQAASLWPVGRFTNIDPAMFTALDCNNRKDSGVSQASGSKKKKVQLTWEAPSDSSYGDVYFSASLVQNYATFWVQLNSSTVRMESGSGTSGSSSSSALLFISLLSLTAYY